MKLSDKILVGFFGFIFIYLTATFAEVRLRGTPNAIDDTNSILETADISGIHYITLTNLDKDINIIGSDTPRIEVRSFSGDLIKRVNYEVSGDTLTLSNLQSDDIKTIRISVFVPKAGLKGMAVNGAVAIVKRLDQDLLQISQNAGRIWMSDNRVNTIYIDASGGSYLDISASDVDTVSAQIEKSEVQVSTHLDLLKGSMKNNSLFRVNNIDEIQFKKDESSKLTMY